MELVVNILSKFHEFRQKIPVSQIVSYQLNYVSKDPLTHGGVYFAHLEQFGVSFKTLEKIMLKVTRKNQCYQECEI